MRMPITVNKEITGFNMINALITMSTTKGKGMRKKRERTITTKWVLS